VAKGTSKIHRSADTGWFVTKETAQKNPKTTAHGDRQEEG
jgi:hypothetical protein